MTFPFAFWSSNSVTGVYMFYNKNGITINDNSAATPYPSSITVAGMNGVTKNIVLLISGFTHFFPPDVGMLLETPNGKYITVMAQVSDGTTVSNINFNIDDAAAIPFPGATAALTTSTSYKPTDITAGTYPFTSPAPAPNSTTMNNLTGYSPNGVWKLYVADDSPLAAGSISSWTLKMMTT